MTIYHDGKIYEGVAAPIFLAKQFAYSSVYKVLGSNTWEDLQEVRENVDFQLNPNNLAIPITNKTATNA